MAFEDPQRRLVKWFRLKYFIGAAMTGFNATPFNTQSYNSPRPPLYNIPVSETPEGKERLRAYYEALGRFVDAFARVETAVALTLRLYAKTTGEIAKVIFAAARIETSSSFIKQLAEATKVPKEPRDDLEYVLQQLGIISGARNMILHYGATSVAEGRGIVSDVLRAKGEPTVFPISPTALDQMTEDLRKISTHLNYRHLGRPMPRSALVQSALQGIFDSPWKYKHPVPSKARNKKTAGLRAPKRVPRPPYRP
jgi:hypothetical protein